MTLYKEIASLENPTYKAWKELLHSKGIKKQQRALVQGKLIVHEYFKNFFTQNIEILFTEDQGYPGNLGPNTKAYKLSKELFAELNVTGVDYPMLCVTTPEILTWDPLSQPEGSAIFLPLGDPKNLGGALRNALAFEVENVVLMQESANPFHPQAIKASSGACFYVSLFKGPNTKELNLKNLFILEAEGQPAHTLKWPQDFKLLVGEEGQGPPAHLLTSASLVSIPISKKIESLNANQALGIALYEANLQRHRL